VTATQRSPVWHPFTQHAIMPDIPHVARGDGAYLYRPDGSPLVDAISSWWVTTHGHNHPRIVSAIQDQAATLDHVIFAGMGHPQAERLAERLVDVTPEGLDYVFYSDSGSTAVEVALKMALGYFKNTGEARETVVVLEHGYHGDTVGTMSVGERGVFNQAYEPLLFDVSTVPFPHPGREQATLDALAEHCRTRAPAALIVEPLVLGAGGMLMYPAWVLAAMKRICAEHGVLFIADEVMTGWGRTGTLFACEEAGVVPDILCSSKGITGGALPLAVTLCRAAIFDAHFSTDRTKTFFHSSSYTANPIACAAANANLDIWADEPVRDRIDAIVDHHARRLEQVRADGRFTNVRQCGTIAAMDVDVGDAGYLADVGPRLHGRFEACGLLLRPLGNTIYILPPYCISTEDLDALYDAILDAVDRLDV